jgi:hypothetical protein
MSRLPSEDQDWTPPRASESSKDRKCCETGERPIKQASRRIPAQSRISKAKGLPLRSDIDMEGGTSHISTRYEYGIVKPPM